MCCLIIVCIFWDYLEAKVYFSLFYALKVGDHLFCIYDDYDNDDDGLPAYSHHDRFPPWWVFVHDDYGGNLSGDKFPP